MRGLGFLRYRFRGRFIINLRAYLFPIAAFACQLACFASAESLARGIDSICKHPSGTLSISAVDLATGKEVASCNDHKPLLPASVEKIATSGAALKLLGPEFRFKTEIWVSGWHGESVKALYVRGGGDPTLTIESVWLLARRIHEYGIRRVEKLILDDSLFSESRKPVGVRAFQTGASALSFNFNSLGVTICPSRKGVDAAISVSPWESGAIVDGSVKTVASGAARISLETDREDKFPPRLKVGGSIGESEDCAVVYRSITDPVAYFGTTFQNLLRDQGVVVKDGNSRGAVPQKDAEPLYVNESKPLYQVLIDLNHFSNNFTGEQLLFQLGRITNPADEVVLYDRAKGLEELETFVLAAGVPKSEFVLSDGSGLDRANRLSTRALTKILQKIHADPNIGTEFETSLAVGGRSGTLKKRDFEPSTMVLRAKTGHLDGVGALAGFLITRNGKKLAFAILQNGVASREQGDAIEARIVKALFDS